MSVFDRVVTSKNGADSPHAQEWDAFRQHYPNLAELFEGLLDDENKWKYGPATVMLWMECGVMHVCAKPKYSTKVMFSTIDDWLSPFQGLEEQLQRGHYEWKEGRKGKQA